MGLRKLASYRDFHTNKGMLFNNDCFEIFPHIPDESMDMILCDLPYGATARNKWDSILPLEELWNEYNRIIKPNGAIVLTGQGLFTAKLILSNEKMYKYSLVWEKDNVTGHLNAKKQPLRKHEDVLVFYKKQPIYNPQYTFDGKPYSYSHYKYNETDSKNYGEQKGVGQTINNGQRHPTSILKINKVNPKKEKIVHPTQKPVELMEWLIKSFTNEGDFVLDNCSGSGTTAIACEKLNRKWICIEKEEQYHNAAIERIEKIVTNETIK